MNERRKLIVLVICVVAAIALWTWYLNAGDAQPAATNLKAALPRAGAKPLTWPVPAFSFPDQEGKIVSEKDLRGRVTIINFIEINCTGSCPRMTGRLAQLQKELPDPRIGFISIDIDPEHDDTAARLAYGKQRQVDLSRWRFVAPPTRSAALLLGHAMKVAGDTGRRDFAVMLHVDRFVLVNPEGRVTASYLEADGEAMKRLVEDANVLAASLPAEKKKV